MDINSLFENCFNGTSLAFVKAIPASGIIFDERSEYMCKFGCKNFGRKYSCPPSSLELRTAIINNNYKWAILFATTNEIPESYSRFQIRLLNHRKELEIQRIYTQITSQLKWYGIDHLPLSGGSCKKCKDCAQLKKEPCKKPSLKQVSMEAVGIDCQKTMHYAGFDFMMPSKGTINRCGCILTNDDRLSKLFIQRRPSFQKFVVPSEEDLNEMCSHLNREYSHLIKNITLISLNDIEIGKSPCNTCRREPKTFSCPPYSEKIRLGLWDSAILWEWNKNELKENRYNIALKTVHLGFFSLSRYFALSIRDCFCNECQICNYSALSKNVCNFRQILSPSMQSQGIDPKSFGKGIYGLELI